MKIIFCLPGRQFSSNFFICWNKTLDYLRLQGIDVKFSNAYNPICATTRNSILLANMYQKGKNTEQKPFGGNVTYDYLFWIDDDIVWNPEQIMQLIDHKKDIVSGCYLMQGLVGGKQTYPICRNMDDKDLIETGTYKFISKQEMAEEKNFFSTPKKRTGKKLILYFSTRPAYIICHDKFFRLVNKKKKASSNNQRSTCKYSTNSIKRRRRFR